MNAEAISTFSSIGTDNRINTVRMRLSLRSPKAGVRKVRYDWKAFSAMPDRQQR